MVEVFPLDAEKKIGQRAVHDQDHPDDAQDDLHSDAFIPGHLCAGSPNLHTVYIVPARQEGKTGGSTAIRRGSILRRSTRLRRCRFFPYGIVVMKVGDTDGAGRFHAGK
jgi:hypothetical protein